MGRIQTYPISVVNDADPGHLDPGGYGQIWQGINPKISFLPLLGCCESTSFTDATQEIHLYLGHCVKSQSLAITPCILTNRTHTQKDTKHEYRKKKTHNPVVNCPRYYQVKHPTNLQFSFLLFHTNNPEVPLATLNTLRRQFS